ncbi:MAG: tetratricopeptide repeat protein, partial [Stellaceae bacterium]
MNKNRLTRAATAVSIAALMFGLSGCGSLHLSAGGDRRELADLPNKDQAMLRLGDASREAGDCMAAVRFYRIALDKGGKPAEIAAARIGAADCELASGALADAERDYHAALGEAPGNGAAELGLGRLRLIEHRPAEALEFFNAAIKRGAGNAVALNDKGVALDELKRHRDAQQSYRDGLAKYPADRSLRNNLGLSLAMTGDFVEAERLLRPLAEDAGATARTRENLALVLGLKGDAAGADRASRPDLDAAALANNARYYEYARGTIAGDEKPPKAAPVAPVA